MLMYTPTVVVEGSSRCADERFPVMVQPADTPRNGTHSSAFYPEVAILLELPIGGNNSPPSTLIEDESPAK